MSTANAAKGRKLSALAAFGVLDELIYTLSNVVLSIALARMLDVASMSRFSVAMRFATGATLVAWAVIAERLANASNLTWRERVGPILTSSMLYSAAGATLVTALLWFVADYFTLVPFFAPLLIWQITARHQAFRVRRPDLALVADSAWLVLVFVAAVAAVGARGIEIAWFAGLVVALAFLLWRLPHAVVPTARATESTGAAHHASLGSAAMDRAVAIGLSYLFLLFTGTVSSAGPAVMAAVATIYGPALLLLSSLRTNLYELFGHLASLPVLSKLGGWFPMAIGALAWLPMTLVFVVLSKTGLLEVIFGDTGIEVARYLAPSAFLQFGLLTASGYVPFVRAVHWERSSIVYNVIASGTAIAVLLASSSLLAGMYAMGAVRVGLCAVWALRLRGIDDPLELVKRNE